MIGGGLAASGRRYVKPAGKQRKVES